MHLIRTPVQLRLSALWIAAFPAIAAVQIMLLKKIPYWKLTPAPFLPEVPILAGACWIMAYFVWRGRRRAFETVRAFGILWCAASLWVSARDALTLLGLFSIGLSLAWLGFIAYLSNAFHLPYLDPGLRWFQGRPEPISGLLADLGEAGTARVSRLDETGAFVFFDPPRDLGEKNLPTSRVWETGFRFRGREIRCSAVPMSRLTSDKASECVGIGLQFKDVNQDLSKDLADFVEGLRGEGHVS